MQISRFWRCAIHLAVLFLCAPSLAHARVEPGTLPWELQGEGSVLNHLQKVASDLQQGHRFKALRTTHSYDRNGEVLVIAADEVIKYRATLAGAWKGRSGRWLLFMVPDERVIYREAERIAFFDDFADSEAELSAADNNARAERKAAQMDRDMTIVREKVIPVIIERLIATAVFISIIGIFILYKRSRMRVAKHLFDDVPKDSGLIIDQVVPYQMRSTRYRQVGFKGEIRSGGVVDVRPDTKREFKQGEALFARGHWKGKETASRIYLSSGAYDHLGRKEVDIESVEHAVARRVGPTRTSDSAGSTRIRSTEAFTIDFVPADQSAGYKLESIIVEGEVSGNLLILQPMRFIPRTSQLLTRIVKVTAIAAIAVWLMLPEGHIHHMSKMHLGEGATTFFFFMAALLGFFQITPVWVVAAGCLFALSTEHSIALLALGALYMGVVWTRRKSFRDFMRGQDSESL